MGITSYVLHVLPPLRRRSLTGTTQATGANIDPTQSPQVSPIHLPAGVEMTAPSTILENSQNQTALTLPRRVKSLTKEIKTELQNLKTIAENKQCTGLDPEIAYMADVIEILDKHIEDDPNYVSSWRGRHDRVMILIVI